MTFGIKRMGMLSEALRLSSKDLGQFGRTLIIAPHPDDESLACGGLIAILRNLKVDVEFIFVSDGSMSHPHSKEFSLVDRSAMRREEALQALAAFGIEETKARFLNLQDGSVPGSQDSGFQEVAELMGKHLREIQPETVFIPFELDPHPDHKASWQIMQRAFTEIKHSPRIFEYPVWLWELGRSEDYPDSSSKIIWRLDTGDVMNTKRKAIAAHRSQLGQVIHDDPSGFVLRPDLLAHFEHPFEIFFESR